MADNNFIELYKITRNSVEHFDKLLGDLRKIMLGFDGIVIAAVTARYGGAIIKAGSPYISRTVLKFLFVGSIFFTLINILFWALEKHYHRYLIISAKLSEEIEKESVSDQKIRLTYQLRKIRECDFNDVLIPHFMQHWLFKISRYIRIYDLLYLFPIIISVFLNLYLADRLNDYRLWGMAKQMFLVCALLGYLMIRHDHWVTKYRLDTISGESAKDDKLKATKTIQNKCPLFFKSFALAVVAAGFAFIISVLFSPAFNSYAKFSVNLFIGLFFVICGRGLALQKNMARESLRWSVFIFAVIVVCVMPYTGKIILSLLAVILCAGIFYYLSRDKTKELFEGK